MSTPITNFRDGPIAMGLSPANGKTIWSMRMPSPLQGEKAFPDSNGGKLCHNIVVAIEAKSIQVVTERVWNDPWPTIDVTYRNITQVHFRAIKIDWAERLKANRHRSEWLDQNARQELLAKKPDLEWSAELPATEDYQQRESSTSPARRI